MKKRTRETQGFEMTPLVDVVFLLLIFFMVSSVFKKDELALLLNLPGSEAAEKKKSQFITVELSGTEVAFNGKKVAWDDLDGFLKNVEKKDSPVDVRVDGEVKYNRVMALLDKLKKYGLTNLSLVSDPK